MPTKPLILLALIPAGCKHPQKAAPVLPHYEPSAKNHYEYKATDCEPNLDPRDGDVQIDPLYCGGGK